MIGDSGEHDPEIFSALQSLHPQQIVEIRIRDVVDASQKTPDRLRYMTVLEAMRQDEACW